VIELELSVQLLTGLATAVFTFVVVITAAVSPARAAVGLVGLAPLAAWILLPEFLQIGAIDLPIRIRRPAVLLVAVAILLRYIPLRARRFAAGAVRATAIAAAVTFWAGVGLSSANWIVAVAALLPAFASALSATPRVAASSDATPPQS
jgi:hypothetical protein